MRFFARLILAAVTVLTRVATAHGTLIVAVTTQDGFVIAADSRVTLESEFSGGPAVYFDGVKKIYLPNEGRSIAYAITGHDDFYTPEPGVRPTAEWFKTQTPSYTVRAAVAGLLERRTFVLDDAGLDAARKTVVESISEFSKRAPNALKPFSGQKDPLCQLVVVQFLRRSGTWRMGSVKVLVSSQGLVTGQKDGPHRFSCGDLTRIYKAGEIEYVNQHVLGEPPGTGFGFRFLSKPAVTFFIRRWKIRDTRTPDAAEFARSLINATSKTSEFIPIPTGVGGSVRVFLIDGKHPAKLMVEP